MTDEIIKALRATKENFAKDSGFDIHRLVESIQREEPASAAQGRLPTSAAIRSFWPTTRPTSSWWCVSTATRPWWATCHFKWVVKLR